jgi:hypothetical protein
MLTRFLGGFFVILITIHLTFSVKKSFENQKSLFKIIGKLEGVSALCKTRVTEAGVCAGDLLGCL